MIQLVHGIVQTAKEKYRKRVGNYYFSFLCFHLFLCAELEKNESQAFGIRFYYFVIMYILYFCNRQQVTFEELQSHLDNIMVVVLLHDLYTVLIMVYLILQPLLKDIIHERKESFFLKKYKNFKTRIGMKGFCFGYCSKLYTQDQVC